ncbi:hypothetical protein BGZ72_009448 [Mortierella alpina]|nr:hypothetical protein BGZ72_009448 [Mortierella alpina]
MATSQITLDLKCLVSGGPDGSKTYALVKTRDVFVLVQALIPADAPHLLRWEYVTAGWSFRESYNLNGDTPSCIMNKAGELIAMGSWSDIRLSTNKTRRGLVYNPHNPLPLVERRWTSNALWMAVDVATDINNYESEWAQLMIDTGADDGSALEVALTGSQLLIRRLHSTGFSTRELVGLSGWTLPRPLDSESTARLQYSDQFLYIFTTYGTYGADDTSLVRIPFNPNSTFSGQILAGPPTGTTPIDISSALNKCNWREGFSTAASDNKFYLFCNVRNVGKQ